MLERVGAQVASFYETAVEGGSATVEYLVWSDRRRCPKCRAELVLWDSRKDGLRALRCSSCAAEASKIAFPVIGEDPVEANLSTAAGRRRIVRTPTDQDLGLDALPEQLPWTPTTAIRRRATDVAPWPRGSGHRHRRGLLLAPQLGGDGPAVGGRQR